MSYKGPFALIAAVVPFLCASHAQAADTSERELEEAYRRINYEGGRYARILFGVAGGRGLRFNNPFRLRTQLGSTEQSLSLTAPYIDTHLAALFGNPFGLQHGG